MTAERIDATDGERTAVSPGAVLQAQRQQLGLGRAEVAAQLKLLPRQIDELEADEYSGFRGDLFCKAHLRAYAGILGMDPEPLLAGYRALQPQSAQDDASRCAANIQIQQPGRGHSLRYWGLGLAASLAVVLWLGQPDQGHSPVHVSEVVDPNDQSSLESLEEGAPQLVVAGEEDSEEFAPLDEEPLVIDLPAGGNSESATATRAADALVGAAQGSDELDFSFAEDCWVEVSDGNGVVIFAALKRAQESLVLQGTGPFKVLLGYAHGVSLNYNGRPIEINVNNRNNSARLVVGNLPVR